MERDRLVRRVGLVALAALAVALLATPAAAQSTNRSLIDELNTQLLYVALPLTLFVEITLIHAIYRFRDNDDPRPTVDDRALEITWNVATAVILVFVGVSGYFVLSSPYLTPTAAAAGEDGVSADVEIEVTAYQWGWEFRYPDADVTTQDRAVIPADADVRFDLTSRDVIHAFYVPKLGLKQDVFPGNRQVLLTNATVTGEYNLFCAELCGAGHARMQGSVAVVDDSEYREWLEEKAG